MFHFPFSHIRLFTARYKVPPCPVQASSSSQTCRTCGQTEADGQDQCRNFGFSLSFRNVLTPDARCECKRVLLCEDAFKVLRG